MKNLSKSIYYLISSILQKKHLYLIKSMQFVNRAKLIDLRRMDYIRMSTLELCANEILSNNVSGNTAELGVYRGDFAKEINSVFPDRKLYLFDTFEGFDSRDVKLEIENSYSSGSQDFSGTSVGLVLSKMPFPDNCIVRKGFFPDTAEGINDTFCFVSIDADLYKPIIDGLKYFYPKLSKGGYIFVHDYNNDGYSGVKRAVDEFCRKENISFVPIADVAGTVVISKG